MFAVSIHEDNRVLNVYDTDVLVDEGIEIFPITPEEQRLLWERGANGDFRYVDGKIVFDPVLITKSETGAIPTTEFSK
jgi:hypothetical protein